MSGSFAALFFLKTTSFSFSPSLFAAHDLKIASDGKIVVYGLEERVDKRCSYEPEHITRLAGFVEGDLFKEDSPG